MVNNGQTPRAPVARDVREALERRGGEIVGLADLMQELANANGWQRKTDGFYRSSIQAITAAEEAGDVVCAVGLPTVQQALPAEVREAIRKAIALMQPFGGPPVSAERAPATPRATLLLGGEREVHVSDDILALLDACPLTRDALGQPGAAPEADSTIEAARELFGRARVEHDHGVQGDLFLRAAATELAAPGCNARSLAWYAGSFARARGARLFWEHEWDAAADWDLEFFTVLASDLGVEELFGPAVADSLKYYLSIAQRKAGVWAEFSREMTAGDVVVMLASKDDPVLEGHLSELLRRLAKANARLLEVLEEGVLAADESQPRSAVETALRLIREARTS